MLASATNMYVIQAPVYIHSFIHSGHFYSAPSSPLPLRGAPDYRTDTVSEFHAEAHRQLQVKDLPKVLLRFHDNSSTDISSTTLRLQTFRLLLYTSVQNSYTSNFCF